MKVKNSANNPSLLFVFRNYAEVKHSPN